MNLGIRYSYASHPPPKGPNLANRIVISLKVKVKGCKLAYNKNIPELQGNLGWSNQILIVIYLVPLQIKLLQSP